ncbi:uncharacterized protein LY79DRAFT_537661 [Colletotrichum navitas]|uniref:Uncharacterized protein n=1 Tax=Colletotrichum navitas TaxID=681940 RepID=A0AAD8QAA0_9PEZI|nr:uncharacterized protein LY79DRAFT_537661 [Colletotrichum navitas]KAK1598615.1 hypothetical protein LY79DRAFT_537661 [Colletotrichum navitas]
MPVCSFVVILSILVTTAGMPLVKKVAHAAGLSGAANQGLGVGHPPVTSLLVGPSTAKPRPSLGERDTPRPALGELP